MPKSFGFIAAIVAVGLFACRSSQGEVSEGEAPVHANRATPQRISIEVGASRYTPDKILVTEERPVTLVFRRVTDKGCGQEVVFPERNIRRDLPLNKPVEVMLTLAKGETIAFTCGMGMYKGTIVASR